VVQVYLKFPDVKGAPQIALRGFQRIHLEPGASQKVHFELKDRDLGMVTELGSPSSQPGITPSASEEASLIREHRGYWTLPY